ncbi:MAG: STAS domain-containing protein [Lachnospiraceae bacterium]|nr:STAS domain-containing protein [Lachnospiraceae bacterium]
MTVEKEKNNDTLTVRIKGSVDASTADGLRDKLIGELDDVTLVRFEMKEMDYISSAGLRVLLEVYQMICNNGGKVVLAGVREEVRDIFELSGFTDFMEMAD